MTKGPVSVFSVIADFSTFLVWPRGAYANLRELAPIEFASICVKTKNSFRGCSTKQEYTEFTERDWRFKSPPRPLWPPVQPNQLFAIRPYPRNPRNPRSKSTGAQEFTGLCVAGGALRAGTARGPQFSERGWSPSAAQRKCQGNDCQGNARRLSGADSRPFASIRVNQKFIPKADFSLFWIDAV